MNNVIDNTLKLKELIEESKEYKIYKKYEKILDDDKEVNNIIKNIKKLQKEVVNKETKKENTDLIEKELDELFYKLHSNKKYNDYITSSKELNDLITDIQKRFEEEFNNIIN